LHQVAGTGNTIILVVVGVDGVVIMDTIIIKLERWMTIP
jgi:hypothetical protein